MKQIVVLFLFITLFTQVRSQREAQIIYYNEDGTVNNKVKTASYFTMLKIYPDHCQKLQYKKFSPLQKVWTYTDSTLNVLQGFYLEYTPEGNISIRGQYVDNLKDGYWSHLNDTGKVILEAKYNKGELIYIVNPDTVKKQPNPDSAFQRVETEAIFKKNGDKGWSKYLSKNLDPDVAEYSERGGVVRAAFRIDSTGKCTDVHLRKSVEYILDQEVIRVIEKSPLWIPAYKNGKAVSAYRLQPIGFVKTKRGLFR